MNYFTINFSNLNYGAKLLAVYNEITLQKRIQLCCRIILQIPVRDSFVNTVNVKLTFSEN